MESPYHFHHFKTLFKLSSPTTRIPSPERKRHAQIISIVEIIGETKFKKKGIPVRELNLNKNVKRISITATPQMLTSGYLQNFYI